MKTLCAILFLSSLVLGQSTEIRRPSVDMETGAASWINTNCGIATYNNNGTSSTLAYDTAGLTTGSQFSVTTSGTNRVTARTFSAWQSTGNFYSTLTLSVSSSWNAGISDIAAAAKVVYSVNGGSTWTLLATPTATQTTTTVTIAAGQDLSQIKVAGCVLTGNGDPGSATASIKFWDIWTVGTLTAPPAGSGSGSGSAAIGSVTSQ